MSELETSPEKYGFDAETYYNAKIGFSDAYKELARRGHA
jgi:hypothetical protein